MGVWVAQLHISDRTAMKVRTVHSLDPEEVRLAIVCRSGIRGTWHWHDDRGWRLLVKVSVSGARVLAVLYRIEGSDDEWHLGSAYPIP